MDEKDSPMSEKEKRIRSITKFYYSKPEILDALVKFSANREVVPRYFEGFGKRPDTITYPSDILGLIQKGATSLHGSEEIWFDPLKINSEMSQEEMSNLRKSWDLLIDIDCPYIDISKEAAKAVCDCLENYGIKNYGIKYSGSKGFHIIVSGRAFPKEYDGKMMKDSFPEWPRAITEFMFHEITPEFRKRVGRLMSFSKMADNQEVKIECKQCHKIAKKGDLTKLKCPICGMEIQRRDYKMGKKRLKCVNATCAGILEEIESQDYYYCEECKDYDNEKLPLASNKYPENFIEVRGEVADEFTELDLVLVAPRHLFRMPYSLHEKTSLVSVVLTRQELEEFSPALASPMKVKVRDFYPNNTEEEAKRLLVRALEWKKNKDEEEERRNQQAYKNYKVVKPGEKGKKEHEEFNFEGVDEKMYPMPIKKLLKGIKDGKKRGLFVLITFFRSMNLSPEYINTRVREWNKLNPEPLKEGYIKSQIDWHLKQRKKILPPNYDNEAFYKDLGILDKKPEVKNPLVEVMRTMRKARG